MCELIKFFFNFVIAIIYIKFPQNISTKTRCWHNKFRTVLMFKLCTEISVTKSEKYLTNFRR